MTIPSSRHDSVRALSAARWRVAIALTAAMMLCYFGFILMVAYGKDILGQELVRGLSVGIALGILVILTAWVLVWAYTHWANTHYDPAVRRLRSERHQ